MPCIFCSNPALCNPVCRAFEFAPDAVKAQMREACAASGQMTAAEVSAHVEAGEIPTSYTSGLAEFIRNATPEERARVYGDVMDKVREQQQAVINAAAPKGEAGEIEAAKGDERG